MIRAKMAQHRVHLREACRRFYEEGVPKKDLISENGFSEKLSTPDLDQGGGVYPKANARRTTATYLMMLKLCS